MVIQHGRIDFPKIVAKMKILNPKSWWMEDDFLDFNWVNFMFHLNFQGCFPNGGFFMMNTRLPFVQGSKVAKRGEKVIEPFWMGSLPITSMYGIFTYIYHILPLKTTKCR